jgi:hypothetical protein
MLRKTATRREIVEPTGWQVDLFAARKCLTLKKDAQGGSAGKGNLEARNSPVGVSKHRPSEPSVFFMARTENEAGTFAFQ